MEEEEEEEEEFEGRKAVEAVKGGESNDRVPDIVEDEEEVEEEEEEGVENAREEEEELEGAATDKSEFTRVFLGAVVGLAGVRRSEWRAAALGFVRATRIESRGAVELSPFGELGERSEGLARKGNGSR